MRAERRVAVAQAQPGSTAGRPGHMCGHHHARHHEQRWYTDQPTPLSPGSSRCTSRHIAAMRWAGLPTIRAQADTGQPGRVHPRLGSDRAGRAFGDFHADRGPHDPGCCQRRYYRITLALGADLWSPSRAGVLGGIGAPRARQRSGPVRNLHRLAIATGVTCSGSTSR